MIFADSGGLYAAHAPEDLDHDRAKRWLERNREPLIATDYVVDEAITLMLARGGKNRAIRFGAKLIDGDLCDIHRVSGDDFQEARKIFTRFRDKAWSFTDCTSYVVMKRLGIKTAFAFDEHFRQFGFVEVQPA